MIFFSKLSCHLTLFLISISIFFLLCLVSFKFYTTPHLQDHKMPEAVSNTPLVSFVPFVNFNLSYSILFILFTSFPFTFFLSFLLFSFPLFYPLLSSPIVSSSLLFSSLLYLDDVHRLSLAYVASCVEMSITYKVLKPHLDFIIFSVIFPTLCLSAEDIRLIFLLQLFILFFIFSFFIFTFVFLHFYIFLFFQYSIF